MDDSFIPILIFTTIGGFVLYAIMSALVRAPGALQQRKFQNLGNLRGRGINAIIAEVGPPNSRSVAANGRIVCQWIAPGYHIALIFTDDICDGITHEYAASKNYTPSNTPVAPLSEATKVGRSDFTDTGKIIGNEAKCRCQYCDGEIEFPHEKAGQTVACPHCQLETLLFIPPGTKFSRTPQPKPKKPKNFIPDTNHQLAMTDEAKCNCQRCGNPLAFPVEMAGQMFECPHCKCETQLFIPPAETNQTVNCPCQHCGEAIEFESGDLVEENSLVPCPYCGLETKLFIPQTKDNSNSDALSAKDSELEAKIAGSLTDELRKLVEFKNEGILSQEEFEAAKKKLLA